MPVELTSIGVVTAAVGEVFANSDSGMRALQAGSEIFKGEELVTGAGSNVEIRFADDTLLSQGGESVISLDDYVFDPSGADTSDLMFKMAQGTFRVVTGKIAEQSPERFKLGSPLATIGIRGTVVVSEIIPGGGEKIGVEEIHSGKALLIQGLDGSMRMISSPLGMVDISASGQMGNVRPMSLDELNSFRSIAPSSIQQEQEIREGQQSENGQQDDDPVQDNEPGGGDAEDLGGGPDGGVFGTEGVMGPAGGVLMGLQETVGSHEIPPSSSEMAGEGNSDQTGFMSAAFQLLGHDVGDQQELQPVTDDSDEELLDPEDPQPVPNSSETQSGAIGTDTSTGESGDDVVLSGKDTSEDTSKESSGGITISGGGGEQTTYVGGPGDDVFEGSIRSETFWGYGGNDFINAMGGDDTLLGGEGRDTLFGGDGSDTLDGGSGSDKIYGGTVSDSGEGIDFVDYSTAESAVSADLSTHDIYTGADHDLVFDIEGIIGSSGDDLLKGDGGDNTFRGGEGNDTFIGNGGIDTADYSSRSDGVYLSLNESLGNATITGSSGTEVDDLFGIDNIIGSSGGDTISGDDGTNVIAGYGASSGVDSLDGGGGYDYLDYSWVDGGTGVTASGYYGGSSLNHGFGEEYVEKFEGIIGSDYGDRIVVDGTDSGQFVPTIYAGAGDDVVIGLNGSENHLLGQEGDDDLTGGNSGNTLQGGVGDDTLRGGAGSDLFYYAKTEEIIDHSDTVIDFNRAEGDKFLFGSRNFSKDGFAYAADYSGTLSGGETGAYFIWDTETKKLLYDADVRSAGYETVAGVDGVESLMASDVELDTSGGSDMP